MKTCIIIAGPTAVGKTSAAIELARHFNTSIISADSRQCYRELNIGVAKPSPAQLAEVPHYFINSHSIQQRFSAADYEEYALESIAEIFKKNDVAVMVGGTGLYIKAFAEGLDPIPQVSESIKKYISDGYAANGLTWLQAEIEKNDPVFFQRGEMQNPHRMIRALEIKLSSGQSITSLQSHTKKQRDFKIVQLGMEMPREKLYERINQRVDEMLRDGLEAEVLNLLNYRQLNALCTVGYREMFDYFDGKCSLNEAVELIKKNTRHYAKRQMTWFKKDNNVHWMPASDSIIQIADEMLKL